MTQLLSRQDDYHATAHTRMLGSTLPDVIDALCASALSADQDTCYQVAAEAMAAGHDKATIVDQCIGPAALRLGDLWLSDGLRFADVTIGAARLQGLLRTLGTDWHSGMAGNHAAPIILLVVPHGTQHTLGPSVLMTQLRRRGLSVAFLLDATPADVRRHLSSKPADAVFVSLASLCRLDIIARIVKEVRQVAADTPVVVGGLAVGQSAMICTRTGADHATSDLDDALTLCGLTATDLIADKEK